MTIITHKFTLNVPVLLQRPVRYARDVPLDGHPVLLFGARQGRLVLHEAHHHWVERVQDGPLACHAVIVPQAAWSTCENHRRKRQKKKNEDKLTHKQRTRRGRNSCIFHDNYMMINCTRPSCVA